MYSTTNGAASYSMVPKGMVFRPKDAPEEWKPAVTPTLFRQWVQLERYAGKRDYVTVTTKDLAEVWKNHPRRALEALNALSMSGWVAKDENGLQKGTYRLWIPWFRLNDWDEISEYEADGEFYAGEFPGFEKFLQCMDNVTSRRAKGATLTNKRARALRDQMLTKAGVAATPYVRLPVEVLSVAGNKAGDTDVLVWTAMRYFFGLGQGGDIYAANETLGSLVGVRRETVVRSTGRLVKAGFLEDTGRKTKAGTKVYTVPEHLSGKHGAGKNTPVVPVGAGV